MTLLLFDYGSRLHFCTCITTVLNLERHKPTLLAPMSHGPTMSHVLWEPTTPKFFLQKSIVLQCFCVMGTDSVGRQCNKLLLYLFLLMTSVLRHLCELAESTEGVCLFSEQQTYFTRVDDDWFFSDRERNKINKTLIELDEYYECLWNVRSPKSKKTETEKRYGWSFNFCTIFVEFYSVVT